MKQETVYQHYHPDERFLIDRYLDIINRVDATYSLYVSEFLNPRQVQIFSNLVSSTDLLFFTSSRIIDSEYIKVIIAPQYYQLENKDFNLALIEISYNAKFNHLKHGQILGTLINELGIKREKIGDIYVHDGFAQVLVDCSIVALLKQSITRIARAKVSVKEISYNQFVRPEIANQTIELLLSSMRLDKIVASTFKLSRNQAISLIESDRVKVNYRPKNKISEQLTIDDLISVRGFGRIYLKEDHGLSKSGKHKVVVEKTAHK
ncbi:hypothetical protein HMPREF9318_01406 [Streptococcus urinalis FB127-CNA-2]|uniref:S4 domain protein n=1 Tax=Streptococcus urinalis 2285-97 TaxID=764291 RepID=G5KD66_9STRE|nr:YlmH/Sll1252 family protein [Streptococcus urinalis]EHJ55828.1 S4 domain protein [Streptococcus urinalis 2285-97]EKS19330.1 hypothetical protein HMPREF9318_01406 [Streptococcus urinalis FB127-CNA-2]VEF31461.1 RNA-binding protein ylmH [Streptococcus urinalis]